MFRGFIYNIEGWNGIEENYDGIDGPSYGRLELGECEWNEFLNKDALCERCAVWCREGCFDDGSCPAPTHHPEFP